MKAKADIKASNLQDYTFTCSMYHYEKDFDLWWEYNKYRYKNITKEEFKKFPFHNGLIQFGIGTKVNPEDVKVGDVIAYYKPEINKNVSHRVIKKWQKNSTYFFEVLGDNSNVIEAINGSYVYEKLVETKLLKLFEHDGCIEKQEDYVFCKDKIVDLCKNKNLKTCCETNDSLKRNSCFYNYAIKNNDATICCSIRKLYKNSCYLGFAKKTLNETFCELIKKGTFEYIDCYFELGVLTGNFNFCEKLKILREQCVKEPENICNFINDKMDYCYKTVVVKESNKEN